jgi:hypothetical protein
MRCDSRQRTGHMSLIVARAGDEAGKGRPRSSGIRDAAQANPVAADIG